VTTSNAAALYKTVAGLGLTRAQVRRLLPVWWDPAIEKESSGVAELAIHLSRRLSVDLSALIEGRLLPKGAASQVAFKHSSSVEPTSLTAATFIASSLSQAVLAAMRTPYTEIPRRPQDVQQQATAGGANVLGFDALLDLCWSHGMPVIPLPNLPVGVRKMDGAALRIGDRPIIIIARKKSSRAWLSFILAHEIGHVALGHIQAGSSIVDVSLQETATYATDSANDPQEREADQFALQTMGGETVDQEVSTWDQGLTPVELAVRARQAAARLRIESGHFILRHAFSSRRWPEGMTALRFLSEDFDPESALLAQLRRHLDLDRVSDDLRDLLMQVTGWEDQA
jgi:IrrE N-terminal-like domain